MEKDDFIQPKLNRTNLDIYFIRKSIFSAIEKNLLKFKGKVLDVGCGQMPYKNYLLENCDIREYIGLDIDNALVYGDNIKPDMVWDGKIMPINDNEYDTIIGTELLEHCYNPEITLAEIARVLKPSGIFFFTTPFFWPLHESPNDQFRYTPYSLKRILRDSGFKNIEIKAGGGWHASLAQMIGLWIMRSPINKFQRKIFSFLAKPFMKILIYIDKDNSIRDQQMFTNLYGTAEK
ncbi:MAG: class I SAM-dependent methyltransferase [Candidatus Moranbacteria bacterium]|nr:class I SAM-dependent methyltransferase [Candidatus Moranbacteria bacterium]